jgi:zinc-binding in reverse transcriptase
MTQILAQVQLTEGQTHEISWKWTTTGEFTIRSYYIAFKEGAPIACCFASIWKLNLPTRVAIFQWLLLKNKLFTVDNLIRRGWSIVNTCHLCRQQGESAKHMFQQCQYKRQVPQLLLQRNERQISYSEAFREGDYERVIQDQGNKKCKRMMVKFNFIIWREMCQNFSRGVQNSIAAAK